MITSRWRDLRGHLHPRVHPVDVVVSLLLFACSFPGSMVAPSSHAGVSWWPGVLLAGVSCVALLWHRSRPRVTVAVTTACAVGMAALGYLLTVLLLGPLMATLYSLAAHTDRRSTRVYALSIAVPLVVGTDILLGHSSHPLDMQETGSLAVVLLLRGVGPAASLLLPAVLGSAVRLRRAYLEEVKARAEYAERTREEEARHRVAAERMRIARELHDVVAHHLVLANMQAGTAAHLVRTDPDQVQKLLADLSGTTSAALRELKATVGLLRQAGDPDAPTEPAPGLARLSDLTGSFEPAGLAVTVTTEGEPRSLPPGVDLTAFRIVQEALTNVTKHAAASTARVNLAYSHDRLTITVTDDGTGPGTYQPAPSGPGHSGQAPSGPAPSGPPPSRPVPNSGFGLVGMRERALSVGGRLRTGARTEGGFQVTAELPLHLASLEEDRTR